MTVPTEKDFDYQFRRTMSILNEMANGKILDLGCTKIGMAEDMTIGVLGVNNNGESGIFNFSELTLKQLNQLLEENNVGFIIDKKGV